MGGGGGGGGEGERGRGGGGAYSYFSRERQRKVHATVRKRLACNSSSLHSVVVKSNVFSPSSAHR